MYKCYECTLYFNLGCAYIELNNMEMAEKYFKQVLDINPYHLDTYNRLVIYFFYYEGIYVFLIGRFRKFIEYT